MFGFGVAFLDGQTLSGWVGFCHGGPLVLCPSDVMVEDIVVRQCELSSLLASSKAFKCLALVGAVYTKGVNSVGGDGSLVSGG